MTNPPRDPPGRSRDHVDAVAAPGAEVRAESDGGDDDLAAILSRRREFVMAALAGISGVSAAPIDARADGLPGAAPGLAQPRPCLSRPPPHACLSIARPRTGVLHVTAIPTGAVTVDGVARGTTPVSIALTIGPHVVVVTDAAGAVTRTIQVDIAFNRVKQLVVRLTPP